MAKQMIADMKTVTTFSFLDRDRLSLWRFGCVVASISILKRQRQIPGEVCDAYLRQKAGKKRTNEY